MNPARLQVRAIRPTEFRELAAPVEAVTSATALLDEQMIDRVVDRARRAPGGRARILLHRSIDESLHEMLIALPRTSCDVPHKNFKSGKSFHIVRGRMVVMMFSEDGARVTPCLIEHGSRTKPCMIRLNTPCFHTIIPLDEHAVFVETVMGPFTGNEFAAWSPTDMTTGPGLAFAEKLRQMAAEQA